MTCKELSLCAKRILGFLHKAEKLKDELRHSWTSTGRSESVAEHSWRLVLMVVVCLPFLSKEFDATKAMKMAVIHDIGEIIIGDCHAFKIESDQIFSDNRKQKEREAVFEMAESLGTFGKELFDNWLEFEENISREARIVNFLDRLEVCIQHNEANINSWTPGELLGIGNFYDKLTVDDEFLNTLKNLVCLETEAKLKTLSQSNYSNSR